MTHRIALSCLGLLLACGCSAAPTDGHDVEITKQNVSTVDVFTTALLSGDQADVYHPASGTPDSFPIIAFLQGGLVDKSLYSGFANALASAGYVVVVPNHFTLLGPPPAQLFSSQSVVTDVLASMTAADADPASPLYQVVDTNNLGVSGHSFGGAAALYAVEGSCLPPFCFGFFMRPPQLKAAAVYGVNTVNPAGILLDVNTSAAPVALLQGSVDGRATPAKAAQTFGLMETPKGLLTFDGLNHWGIADVQNPAGNTPDPSVQTRDQSWGIAKTAKYAQVVFDAYLKGDKGALGKLQSQQSETGVTVQFVEH
jgi:dienelactone hydrolase